MSSINKKSKTISKSKTKVENLNESSNKSMLTYAQNNIQLILGFFIAIIALLLGYSATKMNSSSIQNLLSANSDTIKNALAGNDPYLFYCAKTSRNVKDEDRIPTIFTDLHQARSSKINFATINCSQVLPSGKTIIERFKLKQDIKPTIFGVAPWAKSKQASYESLKDVESMKKFIDISFSPKATLVTSDKDLWKFCGFSKNSTRARPIDDTCIVLLKGSRYSKTHIDMESRLVKENPRLNFALVDATKRRLSFENPYEISADLFALKVHAFRNTTHYLSMVNPITDDYLSTFIAHAIGTPSSVYNGDISEPISLLKLSSPVFSRKADRAKAQENDDESSDNDVKSNGKKSRKSKSSGSQKEESSSDTGVDDEDRSKEGRAKRRQKIRDAATKERNKKDSEDDEATKREKEKARRENMERQERERLFEDDSSYAVFDSDEDDSDEIIEL